MSDIEPPSLLGASAPSLLSTPCQNTGSFVVRGMPGEWDMWGLFPRCVPAKPPGCGCWQAAGGTAALSRLWVERRP